MLVGHVDVLGFESDTEILGLVLSMAFFIVLDRLQGVLLVILLLFLLLERFTYIYGSSFMTTL